MRSSRHGAIPLINSSSPMERHSSLRSTRVVVTKGDGRQKLFPQCLAYLILSQGVGNYLMRNRHSNGTIRMQVRATWSLSWIRVHSASTALRAHFQVCCLLAH